MGETLTNKEITNLYKFITNKPGHFYRCKACGGMFDKPDFSYSMGRLNMATCPDCGRPLKA